MNTTTIASTLAALRAGSAVSLVRRPDRPGISLDTSAFLPDLRITPYNFLLHGQALQGLRHHGNDGNSFPLVYIIATGIPFADHFC